MNISANLLLSRKADATNRKGAHTPPLERNTDHMKKILVLEDEPSIRSFVVINLRRSGYEPIEAATGEEALEKLKQNPDTLVALLDVMLPDIDGFEVCRRIRKAGNTPVMMLTAKGQKSDRITGFNAGADDYLPKPFDPDELLSRVRAILRRSEAYQPTVLAYGDLTLDPGSGNLSCGKDPIRLSGREFQIMELFMRSPRQVFSAERIMERVWGWDNEAEINVVWVNISNLRKKLKSIGSHVTLQANRGLGYVLEESV